MLPRISQNPFFSKKEIYDQEKSGLTCCEVDLFDFHFFQIRGFFATRH